MELKDTGIVKAENGWNGIFLCGQDALAFASKLKYVAAKNPDVKELLADEIKLLESCYEEHVSEMDRY